MSDDEWHDIPMFYGYYQINKSGSIKSLPRSVRCGNGRFRKTTEKILNPTIDKDGYRNVGMNKPNFRGTYRVHRLLAQIFIPNTENKPQVNHKDGNRLNNSLSNLEWATSSENVTHGFRCLGRIHPLLGKTGSLCHLSKKVNQYDLDGNFIKQWDSATDAANFYGACKSGISSCCNAVNETSIGFVWKY